jgi:hypothetical protein
VLWEKWWWRNTHNFNKRPIDHIAHLRNLCPYRNIFQYKICSSFPFAQSDRRGSMILTNLLLKLSISGFLVLKQKIFKWSIHLFFYLFCDYIPLKWTWPFISTNLNSLHPKIIYCKLNWFWPDGSGEKFNNFSVYFYSFAITSSWRGAIPFIWANLESFLPRMICAKCG